MKTISPLLVLSRRCTDDSVRVERAAEQNGWAVLRMMESLPPAWADDHEHVAVYAEDTYGIEFAEKIRLKLECPSVNWLPELPNKYVKRSIWLTTAKELSNKGSVFVKDPINGYMPARVYHCVGELPPPLDTFESNLLLASEPVVWQLEARCFVADRRIGSMSAYARLHPNDNVDDQYVLTSAETEAIQSFVGELLNDGSIDLPNALVIDVGFILNRGWAVVEANLAWAAALYGCDPVDVLPVLRRACKRRPRAN